MQVCAKFDKNPAMHSRLIVLTSFQVTFKPFVLFLFVIFNYWNESGLQIFGGRHPSRSGPEMAKGFVPPGAVPGPSDGARSVMVWGGKWGTDGGGGR